MSAASPDGAGYTLRAMDGDADMAFVQAVYASTRTAELAPTGWTDAEKQAFLAQQHQAQHRHYRTHYPAARWEIVESGGTPVGRLYQEEWAREIRIIDIALLPQARGRGIGAHILRTIQADADAKGKAVSVHVEKNNPARELYRRLGFQMIEDKGVYDLMRWSGGAAPVALS